MSGMDMLHNQRDKRRKVGNEMPPPMHPARSTPVTLPAAPAAIRRPLSLRQVHRLPHLQAFPRRRRLRPWRRNVPHRLHGSRTNARPSE